MVRLAIAAALGEAHSPARHAGSAIGTEFLRQALNDDPSKPRPTPSWRDLAPRPMVGCSRCGRHGAVAVRDLRHRRRGDERGLALPARRRQVPLAVLLAGPAPCLNGTTASSRTRSWSSGRHSRCAPPVTTTASRTTARSSGGGGERDGRTGEKRERVKKQEKKTSKSVDRDNRSSSFSGAAGTRHASHRESRAAPERRRSLRTLPDRAAAPRQPPHRAGRLAVCALAGRAIPAADRGPRSAAVTRAVGAPADLRSARARRRLGRTTRPAVPAPVAL